MKIAMMTNNYKPFVGGVPVSIELLAKGLIAAGHEVTVFAPAIQSTTADFDGGSNIIPGKLPSTVSPSNPDGPSSASGRDTPNTRTAAQPCMNVCDGVPVFRYASLPYYFLGGAACPNPFDPRIEEEFRRGHYDIIHVHHPMLIGRTAVHLSHRYGVPLVFTYHTRYDQYLSNAGMFRRPDAPLAGRLLRLAQEKMVPLYLSFFLQNCSQVFAPTAGMKEYLTETCGFNPNRTAILPTGIEDSCFHADTAEIRKTLTQLFMNERYGVLFPSAATPKSAVSAISTADTDASTAAPDALVGHDISDAGCGRTENTPHIPLFLSVSRLSHEKNIPFLLRSAARFRAQYRKPFRLAIIGDGPERAEYEALSHRLGLRQEVHFLGNIPHGELPPYYAAADAFLFASKTETQGIVILEAFAGGAPVIAVDASGVRDLVRDRVNGLLCAEDEEAFATNMNIFLDNPALQEQMHRRALATAVDFREESVVKKAIRFYNKTISAYGQSGAPVASDQTQDKLAQKQILRGLREAFFAFHS